MKIEFLEDGSPDCPVIRLFGVNTREYAVLSAALRRLSADGAEVNIHELPIFSEKIQLGLVAQSSPTDRGITPCSHTRKLFRWDLSPQSWRLVCGLLEPFEAQGAANRFQWLAGPLASYGLDKSKIGVLVSFSDDGRW